MPTKLTRQNLAKHVTISLDIEPDPAPYEGNASAIGPAQDDDANTWIREQLAAENQWAWCVVTVEATLGDGELIGQAVLGGCSYENREAFDAAGETAQMTSEALDDLWAQLESRTPEARAKAMAASSRQAITTSFRGPTDSHDTRIIARCEAKRITVRWDGHLDRAGNHAAAAIELMDQLGWSEKNDLVMGGTREGYVFVQVPKGSQ